MDQAVEAIIRDAVHRLLVEFQPEEIILFGSRAWGEPDEYSDIDLLVIVSSSTEKPVERAARAYRSLRGLGAPADVLVRTRTEYDRSRRVHASLEARVNEEGWSVYGRRQSGPGKGLAAQGPA